MDKKEIKELIDKHRKEHLLILKQSKEYKEQLSEILIKLESEDSDDLKDLYFNNSNETTLDVIRPIQNFLWASKVEKLDERELISR